MSSIDVGNLVGQTLGDGRWSVRQLVDDGEFGQSYLADDAELDAEVLLRFPSARLRADASYCRRFSSTVEMLYTSQPLQFLPVIDVANLDGCPIAVVQFTAHHTLADELGPVPRPAASVVEDICEWLLTVCTGLDELHAKKIWHRDLRPGTLWRSISGQVWIGDVSLSQVATVREQLYGRQLTDTGLAFGTPEYMAPELIIGVRYDGAVDQYALCASLFELISGRPAYEGSSPTAVLLAHTREPVPDLLAIVPDVDPAVADLLMRGMAKEPQDRFPNCVALAQAFLSAVRGEPIPEQTLERARASGVFDLPLTGASTYAEAEEGVESETPAPSTSTASTARFQRRVPVKTSEETLKARRKRVWMVALSSLLLLAGGGWFGWRYLTGAGAAVETTQPIARKSTLREGQRRLKSQLKQSLPKVESQATLEAMFKALAQKAGAEPVIDTEALQSSRAELSAAVDVVTAGRTYEQALHQLINGNDALRVMVDAEGKRLTLTTETPSNRAGLSTLALGVVARGASLPEQLQLPVDQDLAGMPFEAAMDAIRDAARLDVKIDTAALSAAGVVPGPVPAQFQKKTATAQESLTELSAAYGNLAAIADESQKRVIITTPEAAKQSTLPLVADIRLPIPERTSSAGASKVANADSGAALKSKSTIAPSPMPSAAGIASAEPYHPPAEPLFRVADGLHLDFREKQANGLGTIFVLVNRGEYLMGAPDECQFAVPDEQPEHLVKISQGYWISQTEVTLREFRAVLGRDAVTSLPERLEAADVSDLARRPVTHVTWFDALEYCNELSRREQLTPVYDLQDLVRDDVGTLVSARVAFTEGNGYRLPTEAEWEFACRAGARYAKELQDPDVECEPFAWSCRNSGGRLQPVGQRTPNRWGLVDMQGNVREWVYDGYDPDAYHGAGLYDPVTEPDVPEQVLRGGAFSMAAEHTRSTARSHEPPSHADCYTGFRVARSAN